MSSSASVAELAPAVVPLELMCQFIRPRMSRCFCSYFQSASNVVLSFMYTANSIPYEIPSETVALLFSGRATRIHPSLPSATISAVLYAVHPAIASASLQVVGEMQLLDARCCGNGKLAPPDGALGGPAPQVEATVVPPVPVVP